MVFDPDTEHMIELDATEGAVNYTENLQYLMDLSQRVDGSAKKQYVSITGTGKTENNTQSGIANYKERDPQINFLAYYGKRDKSNGSFQAAIDNGDLTLSNLVRFNQPSIRGVDTGTDTIAVDGDQTERMESGNTIVIAGSTGNDGIYTVDTVSYDSNNDETDLGLVQSIGDSTVDGQVNDGVKTIVEQKVWLEEYVFDGRIGEEYTLRGQEFEDQIAGGRNAVINQAVIVRDAQNLGPFVGQGTLVSKEGFNIG